MACASSARRAATAPGSRRRTLLAATGASWLGMYLHNVLSLPDQTVLSPETSLPTLVYLCLICGSFTAWRAEAVVGLCVWGWLHLVGGAVLSAAPWFNDSLGHLAAHLLYGIFELPLVLVTTPAARARLGRPLDGDVSG